MKNTSQHFRHVLLAATVLGAAAALQAQTTTTTTTDNNSMAAPANPAPAPAPSYSTSTMATPMPPMEYNPTHFQADAEAVYAFRLRTTGVAADIGSSIAPGSFLGFEFTYFHPTGTTNDAIAGTIRSKEDITTYELAYRFHAPLAAFAQNGQASPVAFYAGVSGGLGAVDLHNTVPAYGFKTHSSDDAIPSAAGVAGLEWSINRNWGVRAGYRYIYMRHVDLFGTRGNIDTSGLEAGLTLHW